LKPLFESWRKFTKDKRTLYHIGPRPAEPKPAVSAVRDEAGEKVDVGWVRPWIDKPVRVGVFLTPNPTDIVQFHGRSGNVYAYKVPEWVIEKSGGLHRYDTGSEILIPEEVWSEAGDEIEFLGKTMDQQQLWDTVDSSYFGGPRRRRGSSKRPSWISDEEMKGWEDKQKWKQINLHGLRATAHPEAAIKMMTPEERNKALEYFKNTYPEALKGEPFEVEWEKEPDERQGWRKDFRLGESPISAKDRELIDLLTKYINNPPVKEHAELFEDWREYLNETALPVSTGMKPVLDREQIENIITDTFSFNSAQSSQHRWGYGQPIIDYDFNEPSEERVYTATIPIGGDADNWKSINSYEGEDLEVFLDRVRVAFSQGEQNETPT